MLVRTRGVRAPVKKWEMDTRFCLELGMTEHELREIVKRLCQIKAEEFRFLGYRQTSSHDIWLCVCGKWKKNQQVTLHGLTEAILTLRANIWMNWLTMSAWKGTLDEHIGIPDLPNEY